MSNILTNNINPRSGNKITIGGVNDTVSIAGTVTYEDVTNVDSVGVITARSGIEVTGGTVNIGAETSGRKILYINSSDNGAAVILRADAATRARMEVPDGSSDLIFGVETAATPTERMRITGIGSVGIGTDAPGSILEVASDGIARINSTFSGSAHIGMSVGGSGGGFVLTDGHFMAINHQPYTDRSSDNNLTERLRIDDEGRLLVGRTTANTSGIGTLAKLYVTSPAVTGTASTVYVAKFSGNTSASSSHALISCVAGYSPAANDTEGHVHFGAAREGSGNQGAFIVKTGTTRSERLRIKSNGDITFGQNGGGFYTVIKTCPPNTTTNIFRMDNSNGARCFTVYLTCSESSYSVSKIYHVACQYGSNPTLNLTADTGQYSPNHNFSMTGSVSGSLHTFAISQGNTASTIYATIVLGEMNYPLGFERL
jgi:hypothetical protein